MLGPPRCQGGCWVCSGRQVGEKPQPEHGPWSKPTRQLQDNYKTITRQSTRQSTRQFKTWHKMDNWLLALKEKKIIYSSFLMRQHQNVHFAPCFELSCRLSCRLSCNCLVAPVGPLSYHAVSWARKAKADQTGGTTS